MIIINRMLLFLAISKKSQFLISFIIYEKILPISNFLFYLILNIFLKY